MEDNSETTFFTAIREGNIDAVKSLLDESPSLINAKYIIDLSPLSLAIGCGYIDIAEELLRHGADPNERSVTGYLFHYPDLLELLLRYNLNPDTDFIYSTCKETLLNIYAHDYSIDKLELLISYGADLEARDHNGMTALHWTISDSEFKAAQILIDNGADIEAIDNEGMTPLFRAAASGSIEMVDILLDNGANPFKRNIYRHSILSYACMTDSILHTSIEKGEQISTFTNVRPDKTVLNRLIEYTGKDILTIYDAAIMNDIEKADELLQKEPSLLDARNSEGMRPLQYAAKIGNAEMVRYLLDKGSHMSCDEDTDPPILLSAFGGSVEVAELLLDNGANMNSRSDIGRLPMHEAAQYDSIDLMRFFLSRDADPNATDSYNNAPIHFAESPECIKVLLDAGADVDAKDYTGDTALYLWNMPILETVRILHSYGADIQTRNDNGETPINYAITRKNGELLDALINAYGIDSLSVFDIASIGDLHVLKTRISENPSMFHATDRYRKNKSLLHYAAEANELEIAKYLVESGIEVDVLDDDGETPLFSAAASGEADVLRYLLSKGANPNAKGSRWSHTPLHRASASDNIEGARILIQYGADINARETECDETPLRLVESNEMGQLLMRAGGIT